MTGLDTNVVVRYLVQDDPAQASAAVRFMRSLSPDEPGFLSLVVIAELVWVLEISYRFKKDEVVSVIETLLRSKELFIERSEIVQQALQRFTHGKAGFADCLIERCGHAAGCQHTITFDQNAAMAAGMYLLK